MNARAEQSMSLFGVMTLAAMAGAVTALLFAPRKGSETREKLRLKMHEAKARSHDTVDSAKSKAQEGIDKLKHTADEKAGEVSDVITEARSRAEDTIAEPRGRGRKPDPTLM